MICKKAAVEWTVGKLLTFILLIIVLILVIWGISTGGFKPLYSKVQGQIDEVLILLNLREDNGGEVTCLTHKVVDLADGKTFLLSIGQKKEDLTAILNVCRGGVCTFNSELYGKYYLNNGYLYLQRTNEAVGDIVTTFSDDVSLETLQFYWNLYHGLTETEISSGKTLDDYFSERLTKNFVLGAKSMGEWKVFLVWENGNFYVKKEAYNLKERYWKELYFGKDKIAALDAFTGASHAWIADDKVYYGFISNPLEKGSFENINWILTSGSGELDKRDMKNFYTFFDGKVNEFNSEIVVSEEEMNNLKNLEGKEILVADKTYVIHVALSNIDVPEHIYVIDGEKEYRFDFYPSDLIQSRMDFLTSSGQQFTSKPVYVSISIKEGNELTQVKSGSYYWDKEIFDKIYMNTRIRNFLSDNCD